MSARAYTEAEDRLLAAAAQLGATVWWRRDAGRRGPLGFWQADMPCGRCVLGGSRLALADALERVVWERGLGVVVRPVGVGGSRS